jgi:hypothetical protein
VVCRKIDDIQIYYYLNQEWLMKKKPTEKELSTAGLLTAQSQPNFVQQADSSVQQAFL